MKHEPIVFDINGRVTRYCLNCGIRNVSAKDRCPAPPVTNLTEVEYHRTPEPGDPDYQAYQEYMDDRSAAHEAMWLEREIKAGRLAA